MKAWLKGGIWGIVIGIILLLIFIVINPLKSTDDSTRFIEIEGIGGLGLLFIFYYIILIVVGAIIGWIVGRVRNKNSVNPKP